MSVILLFLQELVMVVNFLFGGWYMMGGFFSTTSRKSWILYTGQSRLLKVLSQLEIGKFCGGGCLL